MVVSHFVAIGHSTHMGKRISRLSRFLMTASTRWPSSTDQDLIVRLVVTGAVAAITL